jgi:hypothetical protein
MKKAIPFLIFAIAVAGCSKKDENPTTPAVSTGGITGTITKSSDGTVISGATIVTSPATSSVTSDSTGKYSISGVNPTTYTVTASKSGFTNNSVSVTVTSGNTATANIALAETTGGQTGIIYPFNGSNWAGAYWSANIYQGTWFPTVDSVAWFGIDDYSWGQLHTLDTISRGDSVTFDTRITLSTGGANDDGLYFGFGDPYVCYNGVGMGICFKQGFDNGKRIGYWYNNGTTYADMVDTIGNYVSGQRYIFTLILNMNGSLTVHSSTFNGTFTPSFSIPTYRLLISCKDNPPAGNYVKTVTAYK